MKYVLIWTLAAMQSKEQEVFADRGRCERFAKTHTARMATTRGACCSSPQQSHAAAAVLFSNRCGLGASTAGPLQ